jgi:hypothetical protein
MPDDTRRFANGFFRPMTRRTKISALEPEMRTMPKADGLWAVAIAAMVS